MDYQNDLLLQHGLLVGGRVLNKRNRESCFKIISYILFIMHLILKVEFYDEIRNSKNGRLWYKRGANHTRVPFLGDFRPVRRRRFRGDAPIRGDVSLPKLNGGTRGDNLADRGGLRPIIVSSALLLTNVSNNPAAG
eukprot:11205_1